MKTLTEVLAYSHRASPHVFPAGTPVAWRVDFSLYGYCEIGFDGEYYAVVAPNALLETPQDAGRCPNGLPWAS